MDTQILKKNLYGFKYKLHMVRHIIMLILWSECVMFKPLPMAKLCKEQCVIFIPPLMIAHNYLALFCDSGIDT